MRGSLQEPALARMGPLQVLEKSPVITVRRLEVLLLEPGLVGGDEPVRRELEAQERVAQDDDALLREPGAHRMDLPELRSEAEEPADVTRRSRDARVGVAGGELGWRRREAQLPVQRDPAGRILCQEAVQERGPAAGQARDDEWPPDLLVRDPRMPRPIALQHEAVHQHAGQILARREAAHEVQAGLALERPDETLERFPEHGIAEVVEAGPPARHGQHAVPVQAEKSTSGGQDAGGVLLPARRWTEHRPHQRWTRKMPMPINSAPAHWTVVIGAGNSHWAPTTRTPSTLMPVVSRKAILSAAQRSKPVRTTTGTTAARVPSTGQGRTPIHES